MTSPSKSLASSHEAGGTLFFEADLRIPEFEVFIERSGEEEDPLAGEHGRQEFGESGFRVPQVYF
jgi:hypothetical protein